LPLQPSQFLSFALLCDYHDLHQIVRVALCDNQDIDDACLFFYDQVFSMDLDKPSSHNYKSELLNNQ